RNGRKTCVRRALHRPARLQWAGLCEGGQPCPCRTADEKRAEASEDLTRGQRWHPDLRHREDHVIASNRGWDRENGRYCCTQDRKPRNCERGLTGRECHH